MVYDLRVPFPGPFDNSPENQDRVQEWGADAETDVAERELASGVERTMLVLRFRDAVTVYEIEEDQEWVIGRDRDARICIDDGQVSRRHAKVVRRAGVLVAVDLGSRNGTRVGSQLLKNAERTLASGDVVSIGGADLVVATVRAPTPAAGAAEGVEAPTDVVVADVEVEKTYQLARKVARSMSPVLILGETGVGKDVLAQRIHAWSRRAQAPFLRINCGAVPEALFESELFGYEKGAFTGAEKRKLGFFEAASGGTLLLDEVGELPLGAQVKLLGALESKVITRVGGTAPVTIDARIVCATHRDLAADVAQGRFRADLFYRVSAFVLRLPPLRARPAEIIALAHSFAHALAAASGDPQPAISKETIELLQRHPWPGNVRELRNAVEHAMVLAEGSAVILPEHLPVGIRQPSASGPPPDTSIRAELAEVEKQRIQEALATCGGNQTKAAKQLGLSRRALVYKLTRMRRQS